MREIYLDNNATTPIDEEVLEVTVRALRDEFGNPSSAHARGARARRALDSARERVAALLMASPGEIVFTSGGTEGNNACFAAVPHLRPGRRRIVVSSVEHPAVLNPARRLADQGYDVREIPVDGNGELDLDAARDLVTADTALVSVMAANNETGVILRLADVAELAAAQGAAVHVDAVQAVGRIPIHLPDLPVDFLTISGHKLHAPKGVGALFVRRGVSMPPLLLGGSQEGGRRGGTENVAGAVGLGKACELYTAADFTPVALLRDRLEGELRSRIPRCRVHGVGAPRVANTLSMAFELVESEALVHALSARGIHASTGSACHSGALEPSHVLRAMGVPAELALGTVRFSLSLYTKPSEIETAIDAIVPVVEELRGLSPFWDGAVAPASEQAWPS